MKKKILIVLQNAYMRRAGRMLNPVYDSRTINRKNATYSRIVPYLEDDFELRFTECTPKMSSNKDEKFNTDLEFMQQAIDSDDWFAIITFGVQARDAYKELNVKPFMELPHPVSFNWRRKFIEECRDKLIESKKLSS